MPVPVYAGANVSVGNGVTTVFPYNFKILDQTHIEVAVDGAVKTLGSDYTVSGVGNSSGGNVTFLVAPANATSVRRARKVPYKRDVDYQPNGDFKENTVDADLDIEEMQVQQLAADVIRAFKAPLSVVADQALSDAQWAARASTYMGFDGAGNFGVFTPFSPGALAVSAFIQTLLDDVGPPEAIETLFGTTVSPGQINANQVDYNPANLATTNVLRLNSDAARAIYSIAGVAGGRILILHNVGAFPLVLVTDDGATGTAAMRFQFNGDLTLAPNRSLAIQYDATSGRWRLFASPQWDHRDYDALVGVGDFDIWKEGVSFVNPASGVFFASMFREFYDGTPGTFTIEQAGGPATPGAFNGFRWNQTVAGVGDTFRLWEHRVEDATIFNATKATLSFLGQCAAGTVVVNFFAIQFFGSGGGGSAEVQIVNKQFTLTTTLQRFEATFDVPSTAAKNFGANNDDCVKLQFYMPTNAVFNAYFSELRYERMPYRTPFSYTPLALKEAHIARQLKFVRINNVDKADAAGEQSIQALDFIMRAIPAATITAGTRVNIAGGFPVVAGLTNYGGRHVIQANAAGSYSAVDEIVKLDARI